MKNRKKYGIKDSKEYGMKDQEQIHGVQQVFVLQ
jgi:hypothetical protein